ncbi:hypothetical protein FGO68_gene3063 [Halteria grandinella]|uniref:Mitochondrial import inner membrane translocase subunit TIM50 n=1 Tax=Halteria grandinella TaxID=5974 RepID=A0A8J8SUP8_HALGN|nr:hypothetical protein FGO68_gene3063 [Halteria grandinella]
MNLTNKLDRHSISQVRERLLSVLQKFTLSLISSLLPQTQTPPASARLEDPSIDPLLQAQQPIQEDPDQLPSVQAPYLPAVSDYQQSQMYTLVLDLDETLIHYFEMGGPDGGGHFLVRPGVSKFLREMSQLYEVVIFTAAMQDYADWVLDQIDPNKQISYRLYRQHATRTGPVFIKDLSLLGRDLSRILIVDNVAENFQLQPDNGIFIRSWFDDMTDTALEELGPLLKEIVRKQVGDIRDALRRFRDQMLEQLQRGVSNPVMTLD